MEVAHVLFVVFVGFEPVFRDPKDFFKTFSKAGPAFFRDETVNRISSVWTVILVLDGFISLSYTVWPKKAPADSEGKTR